VLTTVGLALEHNMWKALASEFHNGTMAATRDSILT